MRGDLSKPSGRDKPGSNMITPPELFDTQIGSTLAREQEIKDL
jgi:hypothetical protein